MIDSLMQIDEAELKTLSDRYSTLDLHVLKHCICGSRICADDSLCADCSRAAKDSEAWKEYCFETWGIRV